ncbi:MAG: hypothetical protein AVDCRST_MAG04-31, partial [uncultured Acetobacteraceae bacterium]
GWSLPTYRARPGRAYPHDAAGGGRRLPDAAATSDEGV